MNNLPYYNGVSVVRNEREDSIEEIDSIPFPDYELADLQNHRDFHAQMNGVRAEKKYIPVISSRACPFGYTYCHGIFGRKLEQRSPEHFVDEIRMLHDDCGTLDRIRYYIVFN